MSIEEREGTRQELSRMCRLLDDMGVEYDTAHPTYVLFDNGNGECTVFPSQTYDDKLVVFYQARAWCDTAEDVLIACGLMEER